MQLQLEMIAHGLHYNNNILEEREKSSSNTNCGDDIGLINLNMVLVYVRHFDYSDVL